MRCKHVLFLSYINIHLYIVYHLYFVHKPKGNNELAWNHSEYTKQTGVTDSDVLKPKEPLQIVGYLDYLQDSSPYSLLSGIEGLEFLFVFNFL